MLILLMKIKNLTTENITGLSLLGEWNLDLRDKVSRELLMPGYSFEDTIKYFKVSRPSDIHINASVPKHIGTMFSPVSTKGVYPHGCGFVIDPYQVNPCYGAASLPEYDIEVETWVDIILKDLLPNAEILIAITN